MGKALSKVLSLGLVAWIVGFGFYFFAFGQTFEGKARLSHENDAPDVVGLVTFQSRFRNKRFLTHSVYLDLRSDTPTTYKGQAISAQEAISRFSDTELEARVGYRETKSGWGYVITLDLEPTGNSPKETLLLVSLSLIFGCTVGMAIVARFE